MNKATHLTPTLIYELMARAGFRKYFHFGGAAASRELIDACYIDSHSYILDVGCATGKTACYLARCYGCRVVGVDILPGMIARAKQRASREGVTARVSFLVADAQDLPFEDQCFDLVMGEFITGLLADRQRGVQEYLRVLKPGANIGLNEGTLIKTPPPASLIDYLRGTFGIQVDMLDAEQWQALLQDAGVRDVVVKTHKVSALSNRADNIKDLIQVGYKVLYLYLINRDFRRFIKEAVAVPKDLLDYLGYGIYVGRKDELGKPSNPE